MKLFLAIALLATPVLADTFGEWTYSVANGEATITGYSGSGGDIVIPSHIEGVPVVEVRGTITMYNDPMMWGYNSRKSIFGDGQNTSITKIIISSGVRNVGNAAFYHCTSLTSVDIPSTVTNIGQWAFTLCTSLTNAGIPHGVRTIGESAFEECNSLPSINIPNTVTNMGNAAFKHCRAATNLMIPNSVTIISDGNFYGCHSLTNVNIPNSVTNINRWAFGACSSLRTAVVPSTVTSIGDQVFGYGSPNLILSLPPQYLGLFSYLGVEEHKLGNGIFTSLVDHLSTNTTFINNLAQAIISASNNYGLATQSAITTATSNLVTQSEITTLATKTELTNSLAQSRTDGINSVLSNPNLWTLYTTNQISAMAIGDLVLTRTNNGSFVLNYDIEQSEDLQNWTPYQGFAMPLTNLPTNKAFVRIKAKQ